MKCSVVFLVLILSLAAFSQTLVLVSPNGGQTYSAGEHVQISWSSGTGIPNVIVEYAIDGGWYQLTQGGGTGTYNWTVPYLAATCSTVLVRVTAQGISNPPTDVSDSSFAILAAAPDAYEPNDNSSQAYPLVLNDTLKNGMVMGDDTLSPYTDMDFYQFSATAGNLITLRAIVIPIIDSLYDTSSGGYPFLLLYDSLGNVLAGSGGEITYNITYTGTYYCRVSASGGPMPVVSYNLLLSGGSVGNLTVDSPNGNETYSAGQHVQVTWSTSGVVSSVRVEYAIDGNWYELVRAGGTGTYNWTVPYLAATCSTVLVRATAMGISNPPADTSDAPFTILAATPDAYEPNDSQGQAYPLVLNDTLKNGMVMGDDTSSQYSDMDFFQFSATAGTLINLRAIVIPIIDSLYDTSSGGYPFLQLYDSLGSVLTGSGSEITYNITQTGTYYCRVSAWGWPMPMVSYNLLLSSGSVGNLTVGSPNGGETYSSGEHVQINWSASGSVSHVRVEYSIDGNWYEITQAGGTGTYNWTVPYLAATSNSALVRVTATGISNPPADTSDAPFTILAATPDAYEPNNSRGEAYPLVFNDTLKNGTVMGDDTLSPYTDMDFFQFSATAGNLLSLRAIVVPIIDSLYDTTNGGYPYFQLYDSNGVVLGAGMGQILYNISRTGTYYCRASAYGWAMPYVQYNLLAQLFPLLNVDDISLDSIEVDSSGSGYTMDINSAATDLSVILTLNSRVTGSITLSSLPSGSVMVSPDSSVRIKAISITTSDSIEDAIESADITIPYDEDSLNGLPESALIVLWYNETTNEWSPISFTLDTVNNLIIAHTTHFSIYGLFAGTGGTKREIVSAAAPLVWGMHVFPNPANPAITIEYTAPHTMRLILAVYSVTGEKVAQLVDGTVDAGKHQVVWNGIGIAGKKCASGVYVVNIHSAEKVLRKKIMIVR